MKYDYFRDVVPPLEPVDNFQAGGLFKQLVIKGGPKVIEKLREFAPAIAGKVGIPKLKKPWAVFDKKGNPVKDFRLKKEADSWLKGEKDVEGSAEYYEEIIDYTVGKIKPKPVKPGKPVTGKPEDVPAMFYRSRDASYSPF